MAEVASNCHGGPSRQSHDRRRRPLAKRATPWRSSSAMVTRDWSVCPAAGAGHTTTRRLAGAQPLRAKVRARGQRDGAVQPPRDAVLRSRPIAPPQPSGSGLRRGRSLTGRAACRASRPAAPPPPQGGSYFGWRSGKGGKGAAKGAEAVKPRATQCFGSGTGVIKPQTMQRRGPLYPSPTLPCIRRGGREAPYFACWRWKTGLPST